MLSKPRHHRCLYAPFEPPPTSPQTEFLSFSLVIKPMDGPIQTIFTLFTAQKYPTTTPKTLTG